jgi:hypothetical protein
MFLAEREREETEEQVAVRVVRVLPAPELRKKV